MPSKNAFLILAHSDPVHLKKLVQTLNEFSDVYIHLDEKAEISAFEDIRALPNVFFTRKRFWVVWAGISMVDAILELMTFAMNSGKNYGHIGILTGSDYPIKNNAFILNELSKNPEREFIKFSRVYDNDLYTNLILKKHFRTPIIKSKEFLIDRSDRIIRKIMSGLKFDNKWAKDVEPYRGHTWCIITAKCCAYILDYIEKNPWYYEMNNYTFAPDEHFFHTIIANSPFSSNSDGLQKCSGSLYSVGSTHLIDPSLTHWFNLDDWERIANSERYFVRKIRSLDGSELVKKIDRELRT